MLLVIDPVGGAKHGIHDIIIPHRNIDTKTKVVHNLGLDARKPVFGVCNTQAHTSLRLRAIRPAPW